MVAKRVMTRRSVDNTYLHRDFHGALSCALVYLEERYGRHAVEAYLTRFVTRYYAPLRAALAREGLPALVRHYRSVYAEENCPAGFRQSPGEVVIETPYSPAVRHIQTHGYPLAETFVETVATVNRALCDGTGIECILERYDPATGASVLRFSDRRS